MSKPAQLMRRYEISSGLLYHWKEQYAKGRFKMNPQRKPPLKTVFANWSNWSAN
jgi:transposase